MKTRDIGRLFFHTIRIQPDTPIFHMADTWEIEEPFRKSRSLVVRIWKDRALVIGWWRFTNNTEEEALMQAVSGFGFDLYDEEDTSLDEETRFNIRAEIGRSGMDLDTEWQVISMLGVDQ